MGPITTWVERGIKTARIVAAKRVDGKLQRTRPLCPFPQVARFDGRGNSDQAQSFACVALER